MGRFTEEYPLGPEPGPSFLIRKIQADGSSRDFLFDGTPYVASNAAAGAVAPELAKAALTGSNKALTSAEGHGELTARESAWLADPPEAEELAECFCDDCARPFSPKSDEELDARIAEILAGFNTAQSEDVPNPSPIQPQPQAPAANPAQEQRQAALEKAAAAPRCIHIKSDGQRCGAAAIKGDPFCYFHGEARANRALAQIDFLQLPVLKDRRSLQLAIMRVNALIASKAIDAASARLLLGGLRIAQQNLTGAGTLELGKRKREAA